MIMASAQSYVCIVEDAQSMTELDIPSARSLSGEDRRTMKVRIGELELYALATTGRAGNDRCQSLGDWASV
jgi:hypothetical protein